MKLDWNSFDRGVFLVNCLGIVYNPKTRKIIVGKREKDPYVKELTWTFPGGRPTYDRPLEESLKDEIKKKTNLDVEVKKLIYARIVPSTKQFLNIYYLCEPINDEVVAGEKFTEVKWIKPTEMIKYKPPVDPYVLKFLEKLENGEK